MNLLQPTVPAVQIAFESPDQPEVIALIAQLDAYQDTPYPPQSRHALDLRTYARCGRFGAFTDDPLSVFMHEALPAP